MSRTTCLGMIVLFVLTGCAGNDGGTSGLGPDNGKLDGWEDTDGTCFGCQEYLVSCFSERSYQANPGCYDEFHLCVAQLDDTCEAPESQSLYDCVARRAEYGRCLEGHYSDDVQHIDSADKPACLEAFGLAAQDDVYIAPELCQPQPDEDVLACFVCLDDHWTCVRQDGSSCFEDYIDCVTDAGLGRTCREP